MRDSYNRKLIIHTTLTHKQNVHIQIHEYGHGQIVTHVFLIFKAFETYFAMDKIKNYPIFCFYLTRFCTP